METLQRKIHGVDYELKSVEINPHPNPINAAMRRIQCVVLMDEKGPVTRTLKFTIDMGRGNMTEDEVKTNGVALALSALAGDKQAVVEKQANPDGYLVVERA